jgi:Lon protease-like protein
MTGRSVVCAALAVGLLCVPVLAGAQPRTPDSSLNTATLPDTIPIFPLQDVVLFPNMSTQLHIFEARYREMVADALEGDRLIGMVLLQPGYEAEYEGRPPIYLIGCAGVITDSQELADGRYNIVLRSLVRFRIIGEEQGKSYRLAHVEALPEVLEDRDRQALSERRQRLTTLFESVAPAGAGPPPPEFSDESVVNGFSQFLNLDPLARQDLLEREGPLARAQALIELLEGTEPPR